MELIPASPRPADCIGDIRNQIAYLQHTVENRLGAIATIASYAAENSVGSSQLEWSYFLDTVMKPVRAELHWHLQLLHERLDDVARGGPINLGVYERPTVAGK